MLPTETYNPDVLNCLANLSNDEVFTPPEIANAMLDLLPDSLWSNPEATFLDPVCKSGVFLREIAKRLDSGLEQAIPDKQQRLNHIFTRQLFGLAITELTGLLSRRSLYCTKTANSDYSVCTEFTDEQGNIRFERVEHSWNDGKCRYCGASQSNYDRDSTLESHAYQFIHTDTPEEIFKMKFDVVVGNPPYQLSTEGFGGQARPIYHLFIEQAIKLDPSYIVMITPSRWFAGGMGLDKFRNKMLGDKRLKKIVDFHQSESCFSGVEIKGGVNYFLWDKAHNKNCEIQAVIDNKFGDSEIRSLNEFDIFIRHNKAIPILRKIKQQSTQFLDEIVSGVQPFGLPSTFKQYKEKPFNNSVLIFARNKVGYVERDKIPLRQEWIDTNKVLISEGYNGGDSYPHQIIGKPLIAPKNSCCTMTYIACGFFDTEHEATNLSSYLKTRFARFLVFLRKNTQHTNSERFKFVPMQDFNEPWTDEKLYKKYNLTQAEISFIESMIRPME